jgi:hypothetical protein
MNQEKTNRRPILVWIILIIAIFSSLGVFFQCLWAAGVIEPPFHAKTLVKGLGPFYYVLNVSAYIMYLISAILLFRLKKSAISWYAGCLILSIIIAIYQAINTELINVLQQGGYWGFTLAYVFNVAILVYMVYLSKKETIN